MTDRLAGASLLRPVAHPTLISFAFVLSLFLASGASVFAGARLLLASIALGVVVTLVAALVLRDRHRGALFALALVLLLIVGNDLRAAAAIALGLAMLVVERVASLRQPNRVPWPVVTRVANAVAAVFLLSVVLKGFQDGAFQAAVADARAEAAFLRGGGEHPAASSAGPDIFVVLLDGYARADKQLELFGHDDAPFLDALAARGFDVASKSRSNYLLTAVSLASALNMRHLDPQSELALLPVTDVRHVRAARQLINDNAVFRQLDSRSYETIAISSGFEEVALRQADRFIDTGQLNEMELLTFRHTFLGPVVGAVYPDLFGDQQRDRIRGVFAAGEAVAREQGAAPRFVFVHVPSPHAPVVFDASGGSVAARDLPSFYEDSAIRRGISRAEYAIGYSGQVEYLNQRALELVDAIVTAQPDAVVLVLSDHGSASGVDFGNWANSDLDERTANLFAARTPGRSGVFEDDITLVNVFGRLFNAYFGTAFPDQPNRFYRWQGESIFNVVEITDLTRSAAGTGD